MLKLVEKYKVNQADLQKYMALIVSNSEQQQQQVSQKLKSPNSNSRISESGAEQVWTTGSTFKAACVKERCASNTRDDPYFHAEIVYVSQVVK